jgi:hypothetical protein
MREKFLNLRCGGGEPPTHTLNSEFSRFALSSYKISLIRTTYKRNIKRSSFQTKGMISRPPAASPASPEINGRACKTGSD